VALIDGYNVIMQHPGWRGLALAQARRRLLLALPTVPWPVPVECVDVIFDGPSAGMGEPAPAGVRATFSDDADAAIRERIHTGPAERLVVVSDDREIQDTAKSYGTHRYPVAWLLQRFASHVTPAGRAPSFTPPLSDAARRRINDELSKRWKL
jgi:predicted RNA-binding protein with PIN domain